MWYEFNFLIPAGTTRENPVELVMKLSYGIIDHVIIEAAPGCKRFAAVRILQYEHQVIPTNTDTDIALNAVAREFNDRIELLEPPFNLKAIGYSPLTTYDHTYRIGVSVLPPETFPEYSEAQSKLKKFLQMVGIQ